MQTGWTRQTSRGTFGPLLILYRTNRFISRGVSSPRSMVEFQIRLSVRAYYLFHLPVASASAKSFTCCTGILNISLSQKKVGTMKVGNLTSNSFFLSFKLKFINDPTVSLYFMFWFFFLISVFVACIYKEINSTIQLLHCK